MIRFTLAREPRSGAARTRSDENTMSNTGIRKLLARLRDAMKNAELDAETRSSLHELDEDIHDWLDSKKAEPEAASLLKRARAAEAEFAVEHPTAARILGELIEALVRMGV